MKILAADIGGTHARFMVLESTAEGRLRMRAGERYSSAELAATPAWIGQVLAALGGPVEGAAIAVAGPAHHGEAVLTNLDWHIRRSDLVEALDLEHVHLLNDFEALGYVVPHLAERDFVMIQRGTERPGIQALIGAGTGLGQAIVIPGRAGAAASVTPTEGGHATFAPRTELEWALRVYLAERHEHVSWERLLSGAGLGAIYDFLVETGELSEQAATREAMATGDPARVVVERALGDTDPICARALDIFVGAYGARAGDVALCTGAVGGIYVAGGIAVRLREQLREGLFLEAFLDKGRMSRWLERIPVRVITREDAGTLGAAIAALDPAARNRLTALPDISEMEWSQVP